MRHEKIELSPEETIDVLRHADFRLIESKWGKQAEIYYDGEWISFGRTDWKDDVATTRCFDDDADLRQQVDKYIRTLPSFCDGCPGARVGHRHFAVIDSYSDG